MSGLGSAEDGGVIFILMFIAFGVGGCVGVDHATRYERAAAIEAGGGRYVIDHTTGKPGFQYGVVPCKANTGTKQSGDK